MRILKRNPEALSNQEYDLVIIGAGIFGICAAWEAALSGLSVAILEKGDFCNATSANHFKMVHGGIRYLQHGDIYRIRESSRERSALLRIAPHLVHPLPIVIPTYGHGKKGKEFLGAGLLVYDTLTFDRNRGIISDRRIPRARFLSRGEIIDLFPGIKKQGLTGGVVFCDGQMFNPPRLGISFLRSAVDEGVDAANYLEATQFIRKGNRILGVKVQDALSGMKLKIRGKMVLNTAGPWAYHLLNNSLQLKLDYPPTFSRDLAFIVNRRASTNYAMAFPTRTQDSDSILDRGGRHLFAVPWRNRMLIGVWHKVFNGLPEEIRTPRNELQGFIDEVNESNPSLDLTTNDISTVLTGLTLFAPEKRQGEKSISFGKRSLLIDHQRKHHLEGLVTLIGVRFTVARGMAAQTVDLIFKKLGKKRPRSKTSDTTIYGGQIECFEEFLQEAIRKENAGLKNGILDSLIHNYGSKYREVLKYIQEEPAWSEPLGSSKVLKAEVVHAIREEMAQKLVDVVFRRTDLGTAGHPGEDSIRTCAELMASEMNWDNNRIEKELDEVLAKFSIYSNS